MKRFFPLLVVLTMLYTLCLPAFAVDDVGAASSVQVEQEEELPSADDLSVQVADDVFSVDYTDYSLDDSDPPLESSLPAVLVELFGEYHPRTQTVTQYISDGSIVEYTEVVPGLAGLDWLWIASVALFAMFLYCVLRMIGGCLRWS